MATMTESKDAVLRVMRGENPEKVLDGMLETPVDQADQDGPHKPTIEDYGPEELEQMAQAASDALTKMEAVYGNMLKHDRGSAEGCEESMEELRTAAERCRTDPIEGAVDMHKAMDEMCDTMGENAYEGSEDDTSDIQTVMGEMQDTYETFDIKLGDSDPQSPQDADGETSPGQPGGGVKVDVSGIPAGKGSKNEDDDEDDDTAYLDDPGEEEPDDEEPVEADPDDDDDEPPEDEMGGEEEPEDETNGDVPPSASADVDQDGAPDDAGSECPVCGMKMEYSEEAGMDQCGECGYEAAAEMDEPPMDDEPSDEEEPEDEMEQDGEPEDGEEDEPADEPPEDDDEEEPATEARKCPHCRQPMTEDKQRGKNVCSFCKFELDLGA